MSSPEDYLIGQTRGSPEFIVKNGFNPLGMGASSYEYRSKYPHRASTRPGLIDIKRGALP